MAGMVRKSFESADEARPFEEKTGQLEVVDTESGPVGRATFRPGW